MSATTRVLAALVAGAAAGLALAAFDAGLAAQAARIADPVGKLWLNALQMTVVPLVLALVVVGINTASDAAASGRIARRAIVVFILVLAAAALFAAFAAPAVFSLFPRRAALEGALAAAAPVAATAPVDWIDGLVAIVPPNAIAAAANSAMLPLVVFALALGFALTRIAPERRELMVHFFQAISAAMIEIVRWVLWAAPAGVFALILAVCARSGLDMLSALGVYVLVECLLYLAVTVMMLPLAVLFGGARIGAFLAGIAPAQAIAVSTQSSLASLPVMLERARAPLGYPKPVAALVLPMAVSLFRLTSPVQYLTSAAFIAWAFGIDLSAGQLVAGALLAVVVSLGSVGLPGAVTFIATNLPVTQALGLPVGPLGLMLAVDTLPDALATLGNVTGDLTATGIVARRSAADRPVGE